MSTEIEEIKDDLLIGSVDGIETVSSTTATIDGEEVTVETTTTSTEVIVTKSIKKEIVVETVASTDEESSLKELVSPLAVYLLKKKVSPYVMYVIYWKNVYKSAGLFGGTIFLLLSMYCYTILSVLTNFGIAVLVVAFLYRIGMTTVNAVQKTTAEHPFKNLLEVNIEISEEAVDYVAKNARISINAAIKYLQQLFLVKDVFQSMKFGVLLWLVSYIGSVLSPLTVIILFLIVVFTLPKLYEEKQVQIDQALVVISEKIKIGVAKVEAKIPERVMAFIKKNKKD